MKDAHAHGVAHAPRMPDGEHQRSGANAPRVAGPGGGRAAGPGGAAGGGSPRRVAPVRPPSAGAAVRRNQYRPAPGREVGVGEDVAPGHTTPAPPEPSPTRMCTTLARTRSA